jgi:phage-related baseplate assembly protein
MSDMNLPNVIDSPEYKAIFAEKMARFTALCRQSVAADFPEPTAADPSWHHLAEISLTELMIREKINAAAYAQLIKLSGDLDFIFNGRIRSGESFEAYRERMRGRKYEASSAGTVAMYKALTFLHGEATIGIGSETRTASVQDCHVQNVNGELLIHIIVNSDAQDLRALVLGNLTEAFKNERVKPALDVVSFRHATTVPINISGTISLMPGFGADYRAIIENQFRARFEAEKRLGWAPAVSWISKELHQTGVRSVVLRSPVSNIPVQPERYPVIGTLNLTMEVAA